MASETKETLEHEQHESGQETTANADATRREAYQYWGYLFQADKCGTPLLDRLLKGIAEVISKTFEPSESPDLTPSQIAAWYRDVGGDYDVLFKDTAPSSIAFIYRSLGAFHSLQPALTDDGYSSPTIPALKKQGFVTWQTIQLLLGPEEHVPFLQRAVEQYDVVDPETGTVFPKILPKQCFPDKADDAMETWYQDVAARLKREAEEEAARARVHCEPGIRVSTDLSGDGSSADEKTGAFNYFMDPMYRRSRARPSFMRHVSKQQAIYPLDDRSGRAVTQRVRHMLNPFHGTRRKTGPGRYDQDSSDEDATPIAVNPPQMAQYTSHKRPHAPRRESSLSTTDSDSDGVRSPSRRRTPDLRQRRSHEPMAPREYFPAYYEADRRHSHQHYPGDRPTSQATSPQPSWRPTTSPLFATQVAQQMEARNSYDRRPSMPPRTNHRPAPQGAGWGTGSVPISPPREGAPPYIREHYRDRDRERDRDRDRDRDRGHSYEVRSGESNRTRHRRRSTEDAIYPRERDTARTRSHDRVRDEWEDGADSRERERKGGGWDEDDSESYGRSRENSRDRERDRRTHRYVPGVQDGVTGRRYPVASNAY